MGDKDKGGAQGDTGGAGADKGGQQSGDQGGQQQQQQGDQGAQGDKGGQQQQGDKGAGGDKGGQQAARVVPDRYTLKLPQDARISDSEVSEITALARDQQWTNEEAQQHLEAVHEERGRISTRYLEQLMADKDYGGEKLAETQRLANLVLDKIRPKGTARGDRLRTLLRNEGLGNHIEFVSVLADLGKLMDEDKGIAGRAAGVGREGKSASERFYPHPDSRKLDEKAAAR